jgi:hypothetical protein
MKLKVAALAVIGVVASAGSAMADTSVTNTWNNRHDYNGMGTRETTVNRMVTGSQINESQSIKFVADKGTFNTVNIRFDGTKYTGSGTSSNQQPVDPVVYSSYVKQTENLQISETVNSFNNETYQFNANSYSHSVSAESW